MAERLVGKAKDLGPGSVQGAGPWVVINVDGRRYALSRRCRHLGADLANGEIGDDGCLVCPWHQSRYDPENGRMVTGPQRIFARIPGLDLFYEKFLTRVLPLRRAKVVERDKEVYVES
jgi:3-phenylpropionate/trans-cinnamate dioxygenase ferredoxin component